MSSITGYPNQLKLAGALLAVAALVIGLMAVVFTAGPAQAQNSDGTHPDPQPCGPGAANVSDNPTQFIDGGSYAIFDAYWWKEEAKVIGSGTLNNNLCPPEIIQEDVLDNFGQKIGTTQRRGASDIAVGNLFEERRQGRQTTVFHLTDDVKHELTQADITKYPFLDKDSEAGDQIWWLDPEDDEHLKIYFSTALFDEKHWYREENGVSLPPLQYEFEAVREPGIPPAEYGHFFVFEEPEEGETTRPEAIWDSFDADTNEMQMWPDKHKKHQWAFTKPGFYMLSVHLKGHVRTECPDPSNKAACDDWEPLVDIPEEFGEDDTITVTSEIRQYTFYVGDEPLHDQPRFRMIRSVPENSPGGTKVGKPISLVDEDHHHDEGKTYTYNLTGPGHSIFTVESVEGGAQIKVADGTHRHLDHEVSNTYDLDLSVSDGENYKGEDDDSVDDVQGIRIRVTDVKEDTGVTIEASQNTITVGETLYIYASLGDPPADAPNFEGFTFTFRSKGDRFFAALNSTPTKHAVWPHRDVQAGVREYRVWVDYSPGTTNLHESNVVSVTWED